MSQMLYAPHQMFVLVSWIHHSRKPVLGQYVWCQWCSHGGHLACLDGIHETHLEWFAEYEDCPAGCGHRCTSLQWNP
jgi:hypothetical protein